MPEQLTVNPYNYETRKNERFSVVDADGVPIHKGAYVQVVEDTHGFLRLGEIVRVDGATGGKWKGVASLRISTSLHSSTGISSDMVKVAVGPQIEADFQLAFVQGELARVERGIASLYSKRVSLHEELRIAKARVEKFQ